MTLPPTTREIQSWSRVDFVGLDFDDDGLDVLRRRAIEYVENVTGQILTPEGLPSGFTLTAEEAVQRRVEQLAFKSQQDEAETAADDLIGSMSAGTYSETKRDPGVMRRAGLVNPWPLLHDLLWRLMTDERRDWWREQLSGVNAPAFEVTEMDWQAYTGYSAGAADPLTWGA